MGLWGIFTCVEYFCWIKLSGIWIIVFTKILDEYEMLILHVHAEIIGIYL